MRVILGAALAFFPLLAYSFAQRGQGGELLATGDGSRAEPDAAPAALVEPSFLESIGLTLMSATRGERNNNPGNIRLSGTPWQGKVVGTDGAFESFVDARAGIRALAVNLRTYQTKYGLNTVRQVVTRYAPASENDTAAYVRAVAADIGKGPDESLNLADDAQLAALVAAIIRHENGRNVYAAADIAAAIAAA